MSPAATESPLTADRAPSGPLPAASFLVKSCCFRNRFRGDISASDVEAGEATVAAVAKDVPAARPWALGGFFGSMGA